MKLTELSIRKPIAVTMIVILFVLLGIMGYINLGADLFPPVNIPVMLISSTYPGAGADEIEKDVIKPIEDAVSGISGLDKIHSNASEGLAQVTLVFKLSADTSSAFMDTQKALESIAGNLPKDAGKPKLYKYDQNAEPILVLTLSGDKPMEELYNNADKLKERIERVEGVGNVSIFGGMKKELTIKADKTKLDYYGINISQIVNRLQADNINFPGGVMNQPGQDKVVSIEGEFSDINQVRDFRIPVKDGSISLGDIADVSLEYPKAKDLSRANGKTAVGLIVQKQSDANIVETGRKAKLEINSIKSTLKDIDVKIVQDSTVFITSSLTETQKNLIEGVLTTALVLFLFLRQWNSVFIVMIAIPTSLISTFFMMYFSKFSFNMLSLMGLALCVGILVDDSVVVLENIHRHLKMKKDPKTAALDGRSEIGMAAIAITLSDIVVFAPIAFMSGMVGQYFKQFGLVVVFATLFSLFISFTVTPMLASRMFRLRQPGEGRLAFLYRFMEEMEEKLKVLYEKVLLTALEHRLKFVLLIVGLLVISISFLVTGRIGTEFMPYTDDGEFNIKFTLNPGSTIENTDEKAKMIEKYVATIPELNYYYTRVGVDNLANKGQLFVKLVDKKERRASQKDVVMRVRDWAAENMTGVDLSVTEPSMGGDGSGSKPININIKGTRTEVIQEITNKVEDIVKTAKGTIEVGNTFEDGKPSYKIKIDKTAASKYGVTTLDISNAIRSGIEGSKAGVYRADGEDYDVRVKLDEASVKDINDLSTLSVMTSSGKLIPVGQLASVSLSDSPAFVKRLDKQRMSTVSANIQKGYSLGGVSAEINKELNKLKLPQGYSLSFGGDQEMMMDTFKSLIQALILSILLVYMILVVLYESFLTPFVRILALPVGFIGALTMLALTGKSLNMMSMIGLIMLDGLAAKNGTILIDFTNSLMARGMSLRDALLEAGKTRLKPILMTSVAMIVGMLPTALSFGDGSEFKSGMALVIIGGMISSTLLSPVLLPVAYTLLEDLRVMVRKLFTRKHEKNGREINFTGLGGKTSES